MEILTSILCKPCPLIICIYSISKDIYICIYLYLNVPRRSRGRLATAPGAHISPPCFFNHPKAVTSQLKNSRGKGEILDPKAFLECLL